MDENIPVAPKPEDENPQPPAVENTLAASGPAPAETAQQTGEATPPPPATPEIPHVNNSMALSVSAKQDAEVNNSMVFSVAVGNCMTTSNGLDMVTAVGHDLHVNQGAVLIATVGGQAQVENGTVGLLVAKSGATLNNTRVLMTTQQALALGAALGVVFALVSKLLRGKKCC
jgi:hypothetical protein